MKCGFSPGEVAIEAWRDGARHPKEAFAHWAGLYTSAFERAHPLHYAAELRRRIDADYSRPLFLNRVAAELHVSIRRLQRDFKALTGVGVQEYLIQRRVTAACELLRTTEDKVETIAHAVGWSSRKNLNRALARHGGLTPAVIRQRHARAS